MRLHPARAALAVVLGATVLSCKDSPTSVKMPRAASFDVSTAAVVPPRIVISQIYGGGGNSGATLKNDFIELFNTGSDSVDLSGWSVQYASASATGTFSQITPLSGKLGPGNYYLVQEAPGAAGTTALPTPDATGSIAMAAASGRVAVVSGTAVAPSTALRVTCPAADQYADLVSYGSVSTCGSTTSTATLSNTTAAFRKGSGCTFTNDPSKDFTTAPPGPRNTTSPTHLCSDQIPEGPPTIGWIDVSSSSTSFPVGFQTQLFATARTAQGGQIVPASFVFEAVDPEIATVANVANSGIITGVSTPNGSAKPGIRIIATPNPDNGTKPDTFVTHSITIEAPTFAPTSIYATNDEFGDPTPASPSDPNDLLIKRSQYTLSYNESRGTPNWVAYELDARQMVAGQDRCNCFTADPLLPSDKQIFTSDYTGGGFDRGHMTRSFDRTAANGDNASTFYLTNIVPQQADLNQGVWARFENKLGDSATIGGRAVYIITGPLYSRSHGLTFLKNEGKVAIPDSTWKIALIGPRSGGNPFTRGSVKSWDDLAGLTILAVNMPNVAGVRNDSVSNYYTTVRKIEEATGYNFLTLLDAAFRDALEVGDHAPAARYAVNGALAEGTTLTFDASPSSDPDVGRRDLGRDEALTYQWQFSDGATATGRTATHTFAKFGSYTATLTVTDAFGWPNTVTQTLNIGDVAPAVSALPGADLIAGETYSAVGSFGDPGADTWSATVDYGDGTGAQTLALVGKSFALAHTYTEARTFTLTVSVTDDGGATGSSSATIRVITPLAATQGLAQQVQLLAEAGAIVGQQVQPLLASLDAASKQLARGYNAPAANELGAFVNKLNAAVLSGRMAPDAAQQLTATATRIERVLGR